MLNDISETCSLIKYENTQDSSESEIDLWPFFMSSISKVSFITRMVQDILQPHRLSQLSNNQSHEVMLVTKRLLLLSYLHVYFGFLVMFNLNETFIIGINVKNKGSIQYSAVYK